MKIINHIVATAADKIKDINRPLRNIDVYIQAGAALTDARIGEFQDNTGDNISYRNRQYCELTALYWIWKNQKADYYGLEHYRRAFRLTEPEITDILSDDIDAIIPLKVVLKLSLEEQYCINASNNTWTAMMDVLKNKDPLTYECACIIFDKLFSFHLIWESFQISSSMITVVGFFQSLKKWLQYVAKNGMYTRTGIRDFCLKDYLLFSIL